MELSRSNINWSFVLVFVAWSSVIILQMFSEEPRAQTTPKRTPIQLVEIKDDNIEVNDDALYDLMNRDELRRRHLMILSIAGEMRTGKSFIMNFFARYLRYRGWENPHWIDEEVVIADEFEWRRGSDVVTQGIHVSPEIYHVPLEDGNEAAVMLVDTQGLYDGHSSPDTNAKLMALSTLLSSHQILNVKTQIVERDLEHLQLCMEIAKSSVNDVKEATSRQFQTLLFLIRDWDRIYEYQIGDSTSEYLTKFLSQTSRSQVVQEVKNSIRYAFSKIGCYLLPNPGQVVARSVGNLENSDVDDEFFEATRKLSQYILHPKNLSLKRNFDGKLATANDMLHMVGNMGKHFKDPGIPKIETVHKALKRANFIKQLNQSVSIYKTKMKEFCSDIMSEEQLKTNHEKALSSAVEHLKKEILSESDIKVMEEFHTKLNEECKDVFSSIQRKNKHKKGEILLAKARRAVEKAVENYRRDINASTETTHTDEKFNLHHEILKQIASNSFDTEFGDVVEIFSAVKYERNRLIREIDLAFSKANRARLLSNSNIEKARKWVLMLEQEFRKEADQYSNDYHEGIETILINIKKKKMKTYDDEMAENTEKTSVKKSKMELDSELDVLIKQTIEINQYNMIKKKMEFELIGKTFAQELEKQYEKILMEKYIDPPTLENQLNNFLSQVKYDASFRDLPVWGQEIVLDEIAAEIVSLKSRNKRNKDFRSSFTDKAINTAAWAAVTKIVLDLARYAVKAYTGI